MLERVATRQLNLIVRSQLSTVPGYPLVKERDCLGAYSKHPNFLEPRRLLFPYVSSPQQHVHSLTYINCVLKFGSLWSMFPFEPGGHVYWGHPERRYLGIIWSFV
ncbi:hypothetical protein VNO78_28641 [Psophocarpus tetragonolobus]|uniref:Uncharacterized protein n=1 Tax=Psophocarpus tetragonolobus TaxID=3891 RepID=A0AAN9RU20_PSOTE